MMSLRWESEEELGVETGGAKTERWESEEDLRAEDGSGLADVNKSKECDIYGLQDGIDDGFVMCGYREGVKVEFREELLENSFNGFNFEAEKNIGSDGRGKDIAVGVEVVEEKEED